MRNNTVTFEVPLLPVNVNRMKRYPTMEYKRWRDTVADLPIQKIESAEWYGVERVFYFPLYYKNGNIRVKDVGNYIKYADDMFCKQLVTYDGEPIDDKKIVEGSETKVDSEEVKTVWSIYVI